MITNHFCSRLKLGAANSREWADAMSAIETRIARNCRAQRIMCSESGDRHHKTVFSQLLMKNSQMKLPVVDTVQAVSQHTSDNSRSTILLQTATVRIETHQQNQIVRCLLDGGSHRSFIKEDSSKALNLPVVGEEKLNLQTFGSVAPKRITCKKVRVCLRNLKTYKQWS